MGLLRKITQTLIFSIEAILKKQMLLQSYMSICLLVMLGSFLEVAEIYIFSLVSFSFFYLKLILEYDDEEKIKTFFKVFSINLQLQKFIKLSIFYLLLFFQVLCLVVSFNNFINISANMFVIYTVFVHFFLIFNRIVNLVIIILSFLFYLFLILPFIVISDDGILFSLLFLMLFVFLTIMLCFIKLKIYDARLF